MMWSGIRGILDPVGDDEDGDVGSDWDSGDGDRDRDEESIAFVV